MRIHRTTPQIIETSDQEPRTSAVHRHRLVPQHMNPGVGQSLSYRLVQARIAAPPQRIAHCKIMIAEDSKYTEGRLQLAKQASDCGLRTDTPCGCNPR
ncbi:MAG: hypothetical protein KatS3mg107_0703 [Gemmataceae bacterium]|nr:MAG: hypothetical protein KatS3mg107_0703 [Gemmataceae bacterium]